MMSEIYRQIGIIKLDALNYKNVGILGIFIDFLFLVLTSILISLINNKEFTLILTQFSIFYGVTNFFYDCVNLYENSSGTIKFIRASSVTIFLRPLFKNFFIIAFVLPTILFNPMPIERYFEIISVYIFSISWAIVVGVIIVYCSLLFPYLSFGVKALNMILMVTCPFFLNIATISKYKILEILVSILIFPKILSIIETKDGDIYYLLCISIIFLSLILVFLKKVLNYIMRESQKHG